MVGIDEFAGFCLGNGGLLCVGVGEEGREGNCEGNESLHLQALVTGIPVCACLTSVFRRESSGVGSWASSPSGTTGWPRQCCRDRGGKDWRHTGKRRESERSVRAAADDRLPESRGIPYNALSTNSTSHLLWQCNRIIET